MLAISIVILLILSFQVMPVALGIDNHKMNFFQVASSIFLLILGQVVLFLLGVLLGDRFMYLILGIKRYVLFIGFFIIATRMVMEALEIRKGKRTYLLTRANQFILPSIAQAINTFLAGILFQLLIFNLSKDLIFLGIFSLASAFPFIFIKNEKQSMLAVSLLYLMGGGILSILSFYFLFI
jgi:putative Mn2+ efflux pump MntP